MLAIYIPWVALFLFVLCGAAYHLVGRPFVKFVRQLAIVNRRLEKVEAIPKYLEGLTKVMESRVDLIPGYLEGLIRVAEAQVAAVDRQTAAVHELRAAVFGGVTEPQPSTVTSASERNYEVEDANLAWARMQVQKREPHLEDADLTDAALHDLAMGEVDQPGF